MSILVSDSAYVMRPQSYTGPPGPSRGLPATAGRVSITAIAEQPAAVDAPLATLFRDMRQVTGLDTRSLAMRLGTSPHLLGLLEAGDLRALVLGPELDDLVIRYARMVRIEPRPVLDRIYSVAQPLSARRTAPQVPRVAATLPAAGAGGQRLALPPPARTPPDVAQAPRGGQQASEATPVDAMSDPSSTRRRVRRQRRVRRTFVLVAIPLLLLGGLWLLAMRPMTQRVLLALPAPLGPLLRGGIEQITSWSAPQREGLRWIEVEDPRSRKADKLATRSR